ncbi:hypothetical protein Tco_0086007 [Tanacetum coccineum]
MSDCAVQVDKSHVIAPGMYKLDLPLLSSKLKRNRKAHVDYLRETKAHADTFRIIVEQARALKPLDNAAKLVHVNPINKSRQIKRVEPSASTTNTPKQTDSQNSKICNQPLLTSTRLKSSTRVSRSQPSANTKNNRISPTVSSNQKKIVEDQSRSFKSSINKKNRASACNASIKTNVLKANSESVCKTCNECLFNACHDICVVDYSRNVNVHVKSRLNKSNKKQKWKATGHIFTNVGHKWVPTGRNFTIDGTMRPLTRITSTIVVPPKMSVPAILVKKTPPSSKNLGIPNAINVSSSSKSKTVDSKISNNSEPNKNWGSKVSTSPSSSCVHFRSFKSSSGVWTRVAPST